MSILCQSFSPIIISPTRNLFPFHTTHNNKTRPTAYLTRPNPPIVKCRTRTRTHHCCCLSTSTMSPLSSPPPQDSLSYSRAYWVSRSIIAWNVDTVGGSCFLYSSSSAALIIAETGIEGYDLSIELERYDQRLPENVRDKFPHIRDYKAFKVPTTLDPETILKHQLAVAFFDASGKCISVTGLQLPGVIDDLFSYMGPLGAIFSTEAVSLFLWAPTAQEVRALIYSGPSGGEALEIVQLKECDGVWSVNGPRSWEGCCYVYEVSVYHPTTLKIEKCIANDPYARGLSGDAKRTFTHPHTCQS